jgi:hypothetical protein
MPTQSRALDDHSDTATNRFVETAIERPNDLLGGGRSDTFKTFKTRMRVLRVLRVLKVSKSASCQSAWICRVDGRRPPSSSKGCDA